MQATGARNDGMLDMEKESEKGIMESWSHVDGTACVTDVIMYITANVLRHSFLLTTQKRRQNLSTVSHSS